jgi:elongation factor G
VKTIIEAEMKRSVSLEQVRNIGIMAHIDAGKTTTTERLLFYAGKIRKMGEVHEGTSTMDWMTQERERGVTITAAATTFFWRNYKINLIDTPGHVDFTAEVERSLRILDGAVAVFCAVGGVEPQSETVWYQADRYKTPRIAFINKMDRIGANFYRVVEEMRKNFNTVILPLQLPIGEEENFKGVIDLINLKGRIYDEDEKGDLYKDIMLDEEMKEKAIPYRENLLETLSEYDEGIMNKYIHNEEIEPALLIAAVRKATLANNLVPVLCGTALRNKGLQLLTDAIVDYLPSPMDVPAVEGTNPKNQEVEKRIASDEEPFSALAFKLVTDPFVGKLTYFRVYSGKLSCGENIYNAAKGEKARVSRILQMHADKREEIKDVFCGDIVAAVGLQKVSTGDTLCARNYPILLESIKFPEPVISLAIEPKTKADQSKLDKALTKILEEDPTFTVRINSDTGQTIISGMGEFHLEIIADRLQREFNVEANAGKPQVAYREVIRKSVSCEGKFIRQSGGRGQYGHVIIKLEPRERGAGFEFVNNIRGGDIPREYISSVKKGALSGMKNGFLAGFPLMDIKIILCGGTFHEVDSSDIAFEAAASIAVKEGIKKADPALVEPIMKVEIITPKEYMGEIIGNINSRGGRIDKTELYGEMQIIKSFIPLSELFGYATNIRSLSKGRATFVMEFACFEEVPEEKAKEITKKY